MRIVCIEKDGQRGIFFESVVAGLEDSGVQLQPNWNIYVYSPPDGCYICLGTILESLKSTITIECLQEAEEENANCNLILKIDTPQMFPPAPKEVTLKLQESGRHQHPYYDPSPKIRPIAPPNNFQ
jgi:hypothetical protein